jgi:DNA/RNA-binding domain of Phe-tRNA-synthetase-like protein
MTVLGIDVALEVPDVTLGVVVVRDCPVTPAGGGAPSLSAAIASAVASAKNGFPGFSVELQKGAVRDMLRHGRYKPTGRGKPASEYLLAAALEDRFPRINSLVDVINLASLRSLLPISLVDLERAAATRFRVRYGREGESYVFNAAGQIIELWDLLLLARDPGDVASANPIKDSLATKLTDTSKDALAVIYAPSALAGALATSTAELAHSFMEHAGAKTVASATV